MILARRSFLIGLGSMLAAPAIVHAGNLMAIKGRPLLIVEQIDLGLGGAKDSNGHRFEAYSSMFKWNGQYIVSQVDRDLAVYAGDVAKFRDCENIATLEGIAFHEGRDFADICLVPGKFL